MAYVDPRSPFAGQQIAQANAQANGQTQERNIGDGQGASKILTARKQIESEPAAIGAGLDVRLTGLQTALAPFLERATNILGGQTAGFERAAGGQEQVQQAGLGSLEAQQALAGLLGPEAQQAAIAQLESSPQFQALASQGEQAILQNASATGGLRGGNTQAALAQFRPAMLNQLINEQYNRLAGISGMGAQAGQGLLGARTGMAGIGADLEQYYSGLGTELGVGAAQAEAQGKLGQLSLEEQRKANVEEQRRFDETMQNAKEAQVADAFLRFASIIPSMFASK